MGWVFEGYDPNLQRKVALKVMKPELASDSGFRTRFLSEGRAAADLKNDHIVTVYRAGEESGTLFLAMEFLEGESLEHRLRRSGEVSPAEVLRVGREVAEGLAAAHAHGLVHRDIKPGNLWLETVGEAPPPGRPAAWRVKILDFGLVRIPARKRPLTTLGTRVGTPAYMAPEQAAGRPADARSDLFSLGCVLYRMACGRRPFAGKSVSEILRAVATQLPRPVHKINPDLPRPLADLIMKLLDKDPANRPASADEVAREVRAMEVRRNKTSLAAGRTRARPTQLAEQPSPDSPGASGRPATGLVPLPADDELELYAKEEVEAITVRPLAPSLQDEPARSPARALAGKGVKEPDEKGGTVATGPAQSFAQGDSGRPDRLTRRLLLLGLIALLVLSFSPNMGLYSRATEPNESARPGDDILLIHSLPLAWFATTVLVYSAINVVLVFAALIASETQDPRLMDSVIAAVSSAAVAWGVVAVFWLLALLWKSLAVAAVFRTDAAYARYPPNVPISPGTGLFVTLLAGLAVVGLFGGLAISRKRSSWLATAVGIGLFISILLIVFSVQPWSVQPWISWR
jgi:serine/threonine protein kinase